MKRIITYGFLQAATFTTVFTAIAYWVSENEISTSFVHGLIGGILVGIINSFLFYKYAVPKYVLEAVSVDLDSDEIIDFQTPANYISEKEPISGKLFLTNKRIIFKNHKQEKNLSEFSINNDELIKIESFKSINLFHNGLLINTASGEKHMFILDRLKDWVTKLENIKLHNSSVHLEISA